MLMQTVSIALRHSYTFVVMALLVLIIGPLAALHIPTDIFPEIRLSVVAVAWQYTGLPQERMNGRISTWFQRILATGANRQCINYR